MVTDVVTGTYSGMMPAPARTELKTHVRAGHEAIGDFVGPRGTEATRLASSERVQPTPQLYEFACDDPTRQLTHHVGTIDIAHQQQAGLEEWLSAYGAEKVVPFHSNKMPYVAT